MDIYIQDQSSSQFGIEIVLFSHRNGIVNQLEKLNVIEHNSLELPRRL